jgi:FlaA1/EpsC-like NDP-sugar epimerase
MNFKNKIVFVAGGSGTWGNELATQLIERKAKEIRIFSRGEISQVSMKAKFINTRVRFIIGDVRDYDSVLYEMRGADYVFNLAALKHVGICEDQPQEAVKTNIDGTLNLIKAAIELKIDKFIFASTDKAIYPSSLYGMTKGICEKLVIQANALTNNTNFVCVRSGNILGSSGSVVPLLIRMIKDKNKVTITDGKMTRFFLPVSEVAKLMLMAAGPLGKGGEIFLPNVPSFYIKDLVEIIVDHYGDENTEIIETGARAGEKMHELLISSHEIEFKPIIIF